MEYDLHGITPSQVKIFFRQICKTSSRRLRKTVTEEPKKDFRREKLIFSYLDSKNPKENELKKKIHQLEEELMDIKRERDAAINENRQQIDDINISILSIKSKLINHIEEKKTKASGKEKRLKELEERINREVK